MQAIYTLLIKLAQPRDIIIGKRGDYSFRDGYYAYVGSALNGLEQRIGRHLRHEKKLHWHIDYLLQYTEVRGVIYAETDSKQECRVAGELYDVLEAVPGFGCSDCRCLSHLYYHRNPNTLRQAILAGFRAIGLIPEEYFY
jgi:Uri superfamily endonuclease